MFVPVEVVSSLRRECPPLEVVTPSGFRLLVGGEFDPDNVRRLIKALEVSC